VAVSTRCLGSHCVTQYSDHFHRSSHDNVMSNSWSRSIAERERLIACCTSLAGNVVQCSYWLCPLLCRPVHCADILLHWSVFVLHSTGSISSSIVVTYSSRSRIGSNKTDQAERELNNVFIFLFLLAVSTQH
jgi:hypothetical protein